MTICNYMRAESDYYYYYYSRFVLFEVIIFIFRRVDGAASDILAGFD